MNVQHTLGLKMQLIRVIVHDCRLRSAGMSTSKVATPGAIDSRPTTTHSISQPQSIPGSTIEATNETEMESRAHIESLPVSERDVNIQQPSHMIVVEILEKIACLRSELNEVQEASP